jgi:hypothetical protein
VVVETVEVVVEEREGVMARVGMEAEKVAERKVVEYGNKREENRKNRRIK